MYFNGVHPNVFIFLCVLHRKLKCSIFGKNTVPNLGSLLLLRYKEFKTAFFFYVQMLFFCVYFFFLCIILHRKLKCSIDQTITVPNLKVPSL